MLMLAKRTTSTRAKRRKFGSMGTILA